MVPRGGTASKRVFKVLASDLSRNRIFEAQRQFLRLVPPPTLGGTPTIVGHHVREVIRIALDGYHARLWQQGSDAQQASAALFTSCAAYF